MSVNPFCVCQTVKEVINGISRCSHCDDIDCKGVVGGCDKCVRYNAVTDYRAVKEYAREKNHG